MTEKSMTEKSMTEKSMTEKSSEEHEESCDVSANDGWRMSFDVHRENKKADTISRVGP